MKHLATFILILATLVCNATNVRFNIGTITGGQTNLSFTVQGLVMPFGSTNFVVTGYPMRFTPTSGTITTNLVAGTYRLTFIGPSPAQTVDFAVTNSASTLDVSDLASWTLSKFTASQYYTIDQSDARYALKAEAASISTNWTEYDPNMGSYTYFVTPGTTNRSLFFIRAPEVGTGRALYLADGMSWTANGDLLYDPWDAISLIVDYSDYWTNDNPRINFSIGTNNWRWYGHHVEDAHTNRILEYSDSGVITLGRTNNAGSVVARGGFSVSGMISGNARGLTNFAPGIVFDQPDFTNTFTVTTNGPDWQHRIRFEAIPYSDDGQSGLLVRDGGYETELLRITPGGLVGNGSGLTNLPSSAITNAPWLSSASNAWTGTFTGNGSGLTNTFLLPTGSSDDVAINARLAIGQCLLGPGTFVLSAPLTVSGSVLSGSGSSTIIQVSNLTGTVGIGITNGTLRDLVIAGNGGTNKLFEMARVCAGPNSSVHNLTISNHTFGLDTEGGQNVVVSGLRCYGIRDSQGQAAAFHAGVNSSNVVLTGFYFQLCDRGSEIENGAHRVTVQSGTMRDIWQLAGSNTYSFSIDAHTHPGYGLVEDIAYRDIYVTNCNAIHIGNDSGGWPDIARNILVENVVFDGPPVANPTNTLALNHVRDITLRNVRWQGTRNGTNYHYLYAATNVLFEGCRYLDAAYNFLQMQTDTEGLSWRGGEIVQGTNGVLVPAALHLLYGRDVIFDAVQFRNLTNCSQGLFFDATATNVVIRNSSFTAGSACQRWLKWNGKNLTMNGNSFYGTPTVQGVDFGTSYLGTVFGNYLASKGFIFRSDAIGFQVWGNTGTTIVSDSSLTETVTIYARSNSLPSAATLAAVLGGPGAGIRSYTNALLGYTLDGASNLTWKVLLP